MAISRSRRPVADGGGEGDVQPTSTPTPADKPTTPLGIALAKLANNEEITDAEAILVGLLNPPSGKSAVTVTVEDVKGNTYYADTSGKRNPKAIERATLISRMEDGEQLSQDALKVVAGQQDIVIGPNFANMTPKEQLFYLKQDEKNLQDVLTNLEVEYKNLTDMTGGDTGDTGADTGDTGIKNKYYNYYTGEWVDSPDKIVPRTDMGGAESGGENILITEKDYIDAGLTPPGLTGPSTTPVTSPVTTAVTTAVTSPTTASITGGTETETLKLIEDLRKKIADLEGGKRAADEKAAADAAAAAAAAAQTKRQSAIDTLSARFRDYGLEGLIPDIIKFATEGYSEDTITLELQKTDAYKQRFRANAERIKNGFRVLEPGEYIVMEDNYRQMLRDYGLRQFDTDDYVSQFIANDTSRLELSNRIVTAVQRVQNADPAISRTLRDFYGIGQNDLVAYVLDPNQQLPKIERQVAAAEIGTAARLQGLEAGVTVAEQLAAQGITKAEAQKGYATIADILPEATKLSQIYGNTMDTYGQAEAEQEVFNQLASAQRKRQRLAQREIAQFSGRSGVNQASLTEQVKGQF